MANKKTRSWLITYNLEKCQLDTLIQLLDTLPCKYCIGGIELGEENGYKHCHVVVEFQNARSFQGVQNLFNINDNQNHIEERNGTLKSAIDYACKSESKENKEQLCIASTIDLTVSMHDDIYQALTYDIVECNLSWLSIVYKYGKLALYHYDNLKKVYDDLVQYRSVKIVNEMFRGKVKVKQNDELK